MQDETEIGPEEEIPDPVPKATECLEYCRMIRSKFMASDKPIPDSLLNLEDELGNFLKKQPLLIDYVSG